MEQTKLGIGLLLLAISSGVLVLTGGFAATFRGALAVSAGLGLAAGSVLIGTAGSGQPA